MSRSKRAIWGYMSQLLFTVVSVTMGLYSSRALLGYLGEERFGAARTLLDWYAHLMVMELGLGAAVSALAAKALGRERISMARGLIRLATYLYLGVAVLCCLAGLLLWPFLPRLIDVGPEMIADLNLAWFVLLVALISLCAYPMRSLLEARQLGWRVNLYLTGQVFVIVLTSIYLAANGWGITGQAVGYALGMICFALAVTFDARRGWGDEAHDKESESETESETESEREARLGRGWWIEVWKETRPMLPPTAILNVCGRLALASEAVLIAAFLGPAWVTLWFFTTRLPQLAQIQLQGVAAASWAAMAELHAQGRLEVFHRRLVELTRLTAVFGVATLVPIGAFCPRFVELWTQRSDTFGGMDLVILSCANALGVAIMTLWGWCFTGTGRMRTIVPLTVVGTLVNFAVSLGLTMSVGITGPLWGKLIGSVAIPILWLAPLLRRHFQMPVRELAKALWVPLLWGVPFAVASQAASNYWRTPGWIGLGLVMAVLATSFFLLAWLLILNADERAVWKQRFSLMRRR